MGRTLIADGGKIPWQVSDQHLLYRDYDNQLGDDKIRPILVVTVEEAKENLAQDQARRAALRALYWPPKVPSEQKGQRQFSSRTQSAGRFRVTGQG